MKKNIQNDDLRLLQNERNDICISIILPTHPLSPDRRTDRVQLEKDIQEAKSHIQSRYGNAVTGSLMQHIDDLYNQLDFMHSTAGVGLFVSGNVQKLVHFFFPVKGRVSISDKFDIRDLLYESFYDVPYSVLVLSQKEAKLYNGRLNTVIEITDKDFPVKNSDEYEYNRPSRGSSYAGYSNVKEFEKDKSVTEEIRLKSFFRKTDELLHNYLNVDTPIIAAGDNKDLVYFSEVSRHDQNIACNIPGNYTTYSEHELGSLTWKAMKLFLDNKKEKLTRDMREQIGAGGPGIPGDAIGDLWRAALDGRGYKLFVEKDHSLTGYVSDNNEYELYLQPPKHAYTIVPDIVNRIIELVIEKDGEVILVENDALRDHMRMALITRY